ncbi:MAG: DUF4330 family protein [Clostridia bacterium]|nr:DUF4330 family protein [Clostridia bacterium]
MNGSVNTNSASSKKKKNGRFNFVDFTLIVILLLILGALIYSFSPISLIKKWTGNDTRNIQYEVEFTNVDEAFIDMIKTNDAVGDAVTKSNIGTVTMVNNTKYIEYKTVETVRDEGGEAIKEYTVTPVEYPNKYNVLVTITVAATFSEGEGYSVESTRIAVGEKMALKFPNFKCEGYCVGVTEY